MSDSLTTISGRTRTLLKDSASLAWTSAELSECVHQALDDCNQAAGQTWTLDGLDGIAETTVPVGLASLLARGAAAYALLMLAASRADLFNFQPGVCQAYTAAGRALLKQFQCGLGFLAKLRASGLQSAANAPFPSTADEPTAGWQLDDELR